MVIGHSCGFDILKEKIENFFGSGSGPGYKSSMVFRLNLVLSMVKFKFSVCIQIFGLKTTSHGKPDLISSFLRSDLPCEVVFRPKN